MLDLVHELSRSTNDLAVGQIEGNRRAPIGTKRAAFSLVAFTFAAAN